MFFSVGTVFVITVLCAVGLLFSRSVRYGYVFADSVLFKKASFSFYVFSIFVTAFMFAVLCLGIKGGTLFENGFVKAGIIIGLAVGILLVVYSAVVIAVDKGMGLSTAKYLCKKALPVWSACVFGSCFIFLFPLIENARIKNIVSVSAVLCLAIILYSSLFPVGRFKISAGPIVVDNGRDGYSVIFATSDKATGFVEYTKDGKTVKIYDEKDGRKNGQSIIHTIRIDSKKSLSGASYKVGATRVTDELSYGGTLGKTVESDEYIFNDNLDGDVNILTVSDWHTYNKKAGEAAKKIGVDYSAVLLLGDCSPGLMSEKDIADYIVKFGFILTHGEMPIIYVRGNHETRGIEATKLSAYLGMDRFYYETKIGERRVIVLDSCEDKEDSHPEYGGMDDYENYRKKMVSWLENLENNNSELIVFCHAKEICREKNLSKAAYDKLNKMNASLLVSGHEHIYKFDKSGDMPVFVDGGIDSAGKGVFAAAMLKLNDSTIDCLCVDNNGKVLVDEKAEWKTMI